MVDARVRRKEVKLPGFDFRSANKNVPRQKQTRRIELELSKVKFFASELQKCNGGN